MQGFWHGRSACDRKGVQGLLEAQCAVKSEDHFEMIEAVIEAASSHPVQEEVPEVSKEDRERDREVCSASVVHQVDKMLRSLVNKRMLSLKKSGLRKEEMITASKKIYSVKTE